MLRRIVDRLSRAIHDKPLLAPSSRELKLLSELRAEFLQVPVFDTAEELPSKAEWLGYMNRLRELVVNEDPREFTRWNVVAETMFVSDAPYVLNELNYLKQRSDWNACWQSAIKESTVGHPLPYRHHPASSGNLIHHAYHLAQFQEKTGSSVKDLDLIFEFGGGYGSMCRLVYNLGFQGRYVIFDLPTFSLLQKYYLKSLGLPLLPATESRQSSTSITCVTEIQQLTDLLSDGVQASNRAFLATWSISESPTSLRDVVLPLVDQFQSYLIAYQDRFGEVDNVKFFNWWKKSRADIDWHRWQIEHLPGNSYLVGKSN